MVPWRVAWHDALYGASGFYRSASGPAGHFTTSTHGPRGAVFAGGVLALADQEGAEHVVDIGAGRGELVAALHRQRPGLRLTAVDVVERPQDLPEGIGWLVSPGGAALPSALRDLEGVLVIGHEWLDVVPCTVAQVVQGRLLEVLVDPTIGEETVGGPLAAEEEAWCSRHWPATELPDGARVEVGLARDRAWDDLASRVRRGTVLAVDYGHTRDSRPLSGTLAGYRGGALVPPVPDGSCDLTAHVAVDSLAHDEVRTQREALYDLGLRATTPDHTVARSDPGVYLAALARSSAAASLMDPAGLGGFLWVLRCIGLEAQGAAH